MDFVVTKADDTFLVIIEILGTIAFAISGIRLAAAKKFDWFGAYVIGLVTAIGGGTLRDLLIHTDVFWMVTPLYLAVTGISLFTVIIFRQALVKGMRTLFLFDAIGLALFVVIGIEKTIMAGYDMWVAIVMGIITGSFGGIVRDILIGDVPLFFRKDIYATACLAGGLIYWLVSLLQLSSFFAQIACAVTVVGLRIAASYFKWALPILRVDDKSIPDENKNLKRHHEH
ncbi:MAG: trimeric intracellular cation channel family protein [Muribaculaceae bacterium]|nr:trimeric intracellular cation channel family protein [Muribaculaceae bacterium]